MVGQDIHRFEDQLRCRTRNDGLCIKQEVSKALLALRDLMLAGPAPAPLVRAETFYRYQIMLRTARMTTLSQRLALLTRSLTFPEDVTLAVDIDPVDLA